MSSKDVSFQLVLPSTNAMQKLRFPSAVGLVLLLLLESGVSLL